MNIARAARRGKLRLIISGMAVAIAGLLVSFSPIASAHTTTSTAPAGGPKPTIVLLHGAWASSGNWGRRHRRCCKPTATPSMSRPTRCRACPMTLRS